MRSLLLTLVLALLPIFASAERPLSQLLADNADQLPGFDLFNVETTLADCPTGGIEGVWHVTSDDEGVFAVINDPYSNAFLIVVVSSADRNIAPGTVMGVAAPAARKGAFDAEIYTDSHLSQLTTPKRFTLSLSDEGYLVLQPVKNQIKFDFWRLLPYMVRFKVSRVNNRPDNLDGAYRLFPASKHPPVSGPIYL